MVPPVQSGPRYQMTTPPIQKEATFENVDPQKKALLEKISKLSSEIEASRNRRKVTVWVPDRVLCKRFGVLPPKDSLRK